MFGARTETVTLNVKPETQARIEQTGIRLLNRMDLPPGNYQLRVAVRDGSGRVGSVFENLVVPDFNKPLMLSGIVLTSTTASATPTLKADDALRQVLPAPPGALRAFPQTDTVAFYAEAYVPAAGAAHEIDVSATVKNAAGESVFKRSLAADPAGLAAHTGTAAFSARMPLADLRPGTYVLTVAARPSGDGVATASRQVRFTVVSAPAIPTVAAAASSTTTVGPCCAVKGSYEAAVRAFAHGDRGAAAIAIACAPAGDLKRAISSVDDRDAALVEAAAAVHLELTWRALEGNNVEESHEQFRSSDSLFQKIRRPSDSPAFVGAWYLAAVEICLASAEPAQCTALAERGVGQHVAPALTYLADGIVHETAGDLGAIGVAAGNKQRVANLDQADRAYREALVADSSSEEARLRLGRVLSLQGKDAEAKTTLELLLRQTHDARIGYLAHLFLAQLAVRSNDVETAAGEYSAAVAAAPSSRAPYVGLSSLALLAGDEARARESIRRWTTRSPSSALDPWTTYRPGLDQLPSMLDSLLTMISQ